MNAMQPLAGALPRDQSDDGALLRPNYEDVVDRAAEFRLTCARVPPELADAADTARALIANAETNTMDGEDAFVDAEIARLRQAAAAEREAAAARADARERAEEERMERERRAAAERQAAAEREAVERQRQAEAAARKAEADRLRAIADAADARERAERLRRDASFARRLKEEQLAADAERERLDRERRERLARDASFARRRDSAAHAAKLCGRLNAGAKCWLGVQDSVTDGQFLYGEAGHLALVTPWAAGEPNAVGPGCVWTGADGAWRDDSCTASAAVTAAVCELLPPPQLTPIGGATVVHEAGTPYYDQGAYAVDIIDGDISAFVAVTTPKNGESRRSSGAYHPNAIEEA